QIFTIVVNQIPTWTSNPVTTSVMLGAACSFTYTATGTPAPTFSVAGGSLPPGLSLNSSGVLSGVPTAVGTFGGIITASNAARSTTQGFTIVVNQLPVFSSTNIGKFVAGTSGSFTVAAIGSSSPSPTLSETGTLPTGITFNSTSGVLTGIAATGTSGTYNV